MLISGFLLGAYFVMAIRGLATLVYSRFQRPLACNVRYFSFISGHYERFVAIPYPIEICEEYLKRYTVVVVTCTPQDVFPKRV
jgi:hypothetical protein